MRKILVALSLIAALFAQPARADFTAKDASAVTITFKGTGVCSSVVCVPLFTLFDPTGTNGAAVPTAGADAVSNTANGLLSYGRNLVFNGTTWDRWQGAVTNAGTFAVQLTGATNNINNIAGTVSLPTGAATSALQTTGNTALTTINTTLGTPMQQTGGSIAPSTLAAWGLGTATQNSASSTNGQLALGQFNTSPTTISSGNMSPLQLDSAGKLIVNCTGCSASTAITTWAGGTLGAMANYGTSPGAVLAPGVNAFVTNSNANGQATAANSSPVVLPVAQVTADPCTLGNKTNLPISQSGTSSVQLVALSGSTVIYVCSISLIFGGATTMNITTGTGSACVTGNAAVIGDTTANIANGLSFAANGGLTLGNGAGTIAKGAASSELCMILGTNVRASGNVTYVQQ